MKIALIVLGILIGAPVVSLIEIGMVIVLWWLFADNKNCDQHDQDDAVVGYGVCEIDEETIHRHKEILKELAVPERCSGDYVVTLTPEEECALIYVHRDIEVPNELRKFLLQTKDERQSTIKDRMEPIDECYD